MNKLFLLVRANLINSYGINRFKKGTTDRKKVLFSLAAVGYLAFLVVKVLVDYNEAIATALEAAGQLDRMIALNVSIASISGLFFAIIRTSGRLFGAQDNDMLMSLPVPASTILVSKLLSVYIGLVGNAFLVGGPGLVICGMHMGAKAGYYAMTVVGLLVLPVVPTVFGALVSIGIGAVASNAKKQQKLLTILSLAACVGIVVGQNYLNGMDAGALGGFAVKYGGLSMYYLPARWMDRALGEGSVASFALVVGFSVAVAALFTTVFGKAFRRVNARLGEQLVSKQYRMTAQRTASRFRAMYVREFRRYFSSVGYVINTLVGMILMLVAVFAGVFGGKDAAVAKVAEMGFSQFRPIVIAGFCALMMFNCLTGVSISMEGREFWIIGTCPVRPKDIFMAKIAMALTFMIPTSVVVSVLSPIAFGFDVIYAGLMLVALVAASVLSAVGGIAVNLRYPMMNWSNETAVVKRSVSALISTLGGAGVSVAATLLYDFVLNFIPFEAYVLMLSAVAFAMSGYLWKRVCVTGYFQLKNLV